MLCSWLSCSQPILEGLLTDLFKTNWRSSGSSHFQFFYVQKPAAGQISFKKTHWILNHYLVKLHCNMLAFSINTHLLKNIFQDKSRFYNEFINIQSIDVEKIKLSSLI